MQKLWIRKADWILPIVVVCVALLLWGIRALTAPKGDAVVVAVDGEVVARYTLSEDTDVVIDAYDGTNRLVIRDGTAFISETDCQDKICKNHSAISRVGDSIVCLPHRLTVTVMGEGEQPDAVIS